MHKKFLSFLCDPITKENLVLATPQFDGDHIVSGALRSNSNIYEIRNGIPRFVQDEGYSNNFGWQWNKWARVQFEDENIGRPMENHTRSMFKKITEFSEKKLSGKIVLDIGCGPGRFTDIALEMGACVIAVDYSSAIDAAKTNFKDREDDLLFIQCDALRLPLKSDVVDYGFSIGVLHHTPSPSEGVKEAHRVIRKNGEFAISVYGAGAYYTFSSVQYWRKIFNWLWPYFEHYPPLIYSHIFGRIGFVLGRIWLPLSYPIRLIFPSVYLPDLRWVILDTFDSITPSYQSGHTCYEVYSWFEGAGFSTSRPGEWSFTNFVGIK